MIETPNLLIRHYTDADLVPLFRILSDKLNMLYWPRPLNMEETQQWLENSRLLYLGGIGRYGIELKQTKELIGDCGITLLNIEGEELYDLGFIIHHEFWRKGYATEAARAIKDAAFRMLEIDKLFANTPWDYEAAIRVTQKLGMIKVKEFNNPQNRNIRTFLYASFNRSTK